MICFPSPGGARFSGKLAHVYFVHRNVIYLGYPQRMHFPSNFRVSWSSGEKQDAGKGLLSLSNLDFLGFGTSAGSDMDGWKLCFLLPC